MSLNNAIISEGGRSGVGWQVDIPGMISMLTKMGVSGLKRLAESGIDMHTIVCLNQIAEKCPASVECRRELNRCREFQRKQSHWYYKAIEIGTATNFVVDELLKRRSGENVVALMSALLPVMAGDACDDVLLKLFEASGAPVDETPGLGQLSSVRSVLLPLARKYHFKDRVFQFHILFKSLLNTDGSKVSLAHRSLPDADTTVQVIIALFKVVQEDSTLILEYYGLIGAAWLIAYARDVLGLSVCVLKSSSEAVAISGEFHTSKVLVHIYAEDCSCKIVNRGSIEEFFITDRITVRGLGAWTISVDNVNMADIYLPTPGPLRSALSSIALSLVNDYVELLLEHLKDHRRYIRMTGMGLNEHCDKYDSKVMATLGLRTFTQHCAPIIKQRAQAILLLLGLFIDEASSTTFGGWRPFFEVPLAKKEWPNEDFEDFEGFEGFSDLVLPGPAWRSFNLGHLDVKMGKKVNGLSDADGDLPRQVFDRTAQGYISWVFSAVEAASWLALTDWAGSLRLLSVDFFEKSETWRSSLISHAPLLESFSETSRGISFKEIVCATGEIAIGSSPQWYDLFEHRPTLAREALGVVFCNVTALKSSLNLDACFLHVTPGSITWKKERFNEVFCDYGDGTITHVEPEGFINNAEKFKPIDAFGETSVSAHIKISNAKIEVSRQARFGDKVLHIPPPYVLFPSLMQIYVTTPCEHPYYSLSSFPDDMSLRLGLGWTNEGRDLWLQAVDQNPIGQFLAYQSYQDDKEELTILQRHCCLQCTFERLKAAQKLGQGEDPKSEPTGSRIIFGRLPGEEMD